MHDPEDPNSVGDALKASKSPEMASILEIFSRLHVTWHALPVD